MSKIRDAGKVTFKSEGSILSVQASNIYIYSLSVDLIPADPSAWVRWLRDQSEVAIDLDIQYTTPRCSNMRLIDVLYHIRDPDHSISTNFYEK